MSAEEFDDIVPTISGANSIQSPTPSERRSTLYMIPQEEQRSMHLFSQSSEMMPTEQEVESQNGGTSNSEPVKQEEDQGQGMAQGVHHDHSKNLDLNSSSQSVVPSVSAFPVTSTGANSSIKRSTLAHMSTQFAYNSHNESVFDDEYLFPTVHSNAPIVKFDETNPELINHGTLKALIVQLTSPEIIDYNLICDFFLTYRTFVSSVEVMNLLLTRCWWSLQYIVSNQESNIKIGKLVLLRTFVVLRHWILNYFVDDFDANSSICEIFITHINKMTIESGFVNSSHPMNFETKIFTDLKIHWLTQINEFWGTKIDIESIGHANILLYPLPLVKDIASSRNFYKLSKSNTDMSIHTNPSYRRSAMLSLYDQKAHHKCLIFDENGNDENPQMSINNLLLQHKSSRASINNQLQQFQKGTGIVMVSTPTTSSSNNLLNMYTSKRKPLTQVSHAKHNHINLQDNSVGLKKTTKDVNYEGAGEEEEENKENTKHLIGGGGSYNSTSLSGGGVGFSTNGKVKVPSSRVDTLIPKTPVKKMEYIIKPENENTALEAVATINEISNLHKPSNAFGGDNNDIGRKTSIKRLVDNWKKSFQSATNVDEPLTRMSSRKDLPPIPTTPIVSEEDIKAQIGDRVDILSARIIDELEYLIRYYILNEPTPNTIIEDHNDELENENSINILSASPSKLMLHQNAKNIDQENLTSNSIASDHRSRQIIQQSLSNAGSNDELPEHDIDISELSRLNIVNMDQNQDQGSDSGAIPDSSESFQRPASINWNEVELDHSNENSGVLGEDEEEQDDSFLIEGEDYSNNESVVHRSREERLAKSGTQYFDVSSEFPEEPEFISLQHSDESFQSSVSTPSNITQYGEDVTDLGIILSPQSAQQRRQQQNQQNQQPIQQQPHPQRKSSLLQSQSQNTKRISFNEANINFNQKRLSIISRTSSSSVFKRDSIKSYISYDSVFSSSNGSDKIKKDNSQYGLRKKNGYNNLRGVGDIIPTDRQSLGSHNSRSSSLRKSIRFSTLYALTELPFNNLDESKDDIVRKSKRSIKSSDVADSSIFSVAIKCKTSVTRATRTSNTSSTSGSVAIPGISNFVLQELAAIPDESFRSNDPVEFALYKLEGRTKAKKKSSKDTFDNTQDILNEINNANTKDIIDFDDDLEFEEAPLTPRRFSKVSMDLPCSTPVKREHSHGNGFNSEDEHKAGDEDEVEKDGEEIFGIDDDEGEDEIDEGKILSSQVPLSHKGVYGFLSPKAILDVYTISNETLSIEKVLSSNSHISFVLGYDSKSLADHFTTIEQDILQEIDWKELIELKWNKDLQPVNSWLEIIVNDNYFNQNKGVNLVISRFNLMVNWIISEILLTKQQSERILIISRFIHIAQNCLLLQNFSTLMQIILGLTSEKVSKLKETWKNLPPGDILMLKNLEELSSPLKNFLNIRLCINQIKPSNGCIPFVGLYLSDLIFNAERPAFITPPKPNGEENLSNISGTSAFSANEKFINFSRFRTSVHIVKSLSQCIEWSTHYRLPVKDELLSKCLYVKSLDEDEMNYCLKVISEENEES
ncbi:hypothetical protein CLIB1423_15S02696 [[Candida] railenensis]|uniref:Uncharacterized protein n=1 Tax=[Candida] railenensis TaxID=45579 RepID=A0A9P0VZU0_9ASCO|nr:hypothetical protein CLIB1423_15S02696 [[Candida] railenensis]